MSRDPGTRLSVGNQKNDSSDLPAGALFTLTGPAYRQYAAGSGVVNMIAEVEFLEQARQRLAPADSDGDPAG